MNYLLKLHYYLFLVFFLSAVNLNLRANSDVVNNIEVIGNVNSFSIYPGNIFFEKDESTELKIPPKLDIPRLIIKDSLVHIPVFRQGEAGYNTYRIPSIEHAADGTLIAFAEGRRDSRGDPGKGHIDLVYKTSNNGGKIWSEVKVLEKSREKWGASNPTSLVLKSGRIFIFYNVWKPGYGGKTSRPGELDNMLWLRYSDNNGISWSEPQDITSQGRDITNWGCVVFGPGKAIETGSGRLIVPANAAIAGNDSILNAAFVIYSDDGGKSWKRGDQIDAYTNENQIVELNDSRILIDARQSGKIDTRWRAFSTDGGETWSKPDIGQVCPPICAGLINYPVRRHKQDILVWSGLKGPERNNLILRLSSDRGLSFPAELLVGPCPAAYSSLILTGKGEIGILWEGGKKFRHEMIIYTIIPRKIVKKLIRIAQEQTISMQ